MTNPEVKFSQIEDYIKENKDESGINRYGFSKALLNSYTMALAKEHGSNILVSSISPCWVKTRMGGNSGELTPEEGTRSIRHCLFSQLGGNGWYFGSDAKRSPLHLQRNPGEPEYDGALLI